jgi:hypothetical protein
MADRVSPYTLSQLITGVPSTAASGQGVEYTESGIPRITVRPASDAESWDAFPVAEKADPWAEYPKAESRAMDFAKSTGVGVGKGAIGLGGMVGDVRELITKGAGAVGISPETTKKAITFANPLLGPVVANAPTSADIQGKIEGVTGEFYKPQYTTGEYGQTIGEMLPASLLGPAGGARVAAGNVAKYAVLPGITSETAGQLAQKYAPDYETAARTGTAIVTGGTAAALSRPGSASRALQGQLPDFVTPAHVQRAEALIQAAQQRGITLTWPEALSQVTGRPVLTGMQRTVEGAAASRPQMQAVMGERPQQIGTAGQAAFGKVGPVSPNPSMIGPQVGAAAEHVIGRVNAAINTATRPSYDAARQTLVPQNVHAAMMADPLFEQALNAVRNDPARNSFIRGLSDRSTIVYDAVKQELAERSTNALNPAQPGASRTVSAATGSLSGDVRDIAVAADRAAMGLRPGGPGVGNLEHALAEQARLREQFLEPLQRGPLGRLADKDITTRKAIETLFPENPVPHTAGEVADAVRAVAQRSPRAAEELVRAHIEWTFSKSIQNLISGENQWGGAKFAAVLVGNPQQRANLRAAVEALPGGQQRWQNFNTFLEIVEATGKRLQQGTHTAFTIDELRALGASGAVVGAAKLIGSPGKLLSLIHDKLTGWQQGRNLNELAHILTDPRSGPLLQRLAELPRGSDRAAAAAVRLILQAHQSMNRPEK